MKKKLDWIALVTKTIMWVLGIFLIYMLILKLTGHSPGYETIFGAALGIIITNLFYINYKLGRLDEKTILAKNSFGYIKEDIEKINSDINKINTNLIKIWKKGKI